MKRPGFAVLCAAALCTATAHSADRVKVQELVLASRADIPLVGLFKEAVRERLGGKSPQQTDCYQDIPADAFQKAAIEYLAVTLEDADVAQGLAFYATPVGRKVAANNHPDLGQPPPLGLDRQEFEQHEAFSLTRAGNELLAPNGLLQSRQVKKHFEALFARKWKECGAPPKPG